MLGTAAAERACNHYGTESRHHVQMLHATDADLGAKVQLMTVNASSKLPSAAVPQVQSLILCHAGNPVRNSACIACAAACHWGRTCHVSSNGCDHMMPSGGRMRHAGLLNKDARVLSVTDPRLLIPYALQVPLRQQRQAQELKQHLAT